MRASAATATRYFPAPQTGSTSWFVGKQKGGKSSSAVSYGHVTRGAQGGAVRDHVHMLLVLTALTGGGYAISAPGVMAGIAVASSLRKAPVDLISKSLRSFREPGARHRVSGIVVDYAERTLERIREGGLAIERVVSTADGEVAFYFVGQERTPGGAHRRYGTVLCDADLALTALYEDRISGETAAWEVPAEELDEALAIIGGFIRG